jgi:pimeloyl-ACP methyl ester carboxylesterase
MILPRKGIATLRLDDRGIGGSSKGTKTIPQQICYWYRSCNNLLANKGYLNIGLLGHSEGGMIAPMVAAKSKKYTIYSFNGTRDSGWRLLTSKII